MPIQDERHLAKLATREAVQDPIRQQADAIEQKVLGDKALELQKQGDQMRQQGNFPVRGDQVDWRALACHDGGVPEKLPYRFMSAEAPQRYLWGVDMASCVPVDYESEVSVLDEATGADFLTALGADSKKLDAAMSKHAATIWDVLTSIPKGVLDALYNIGDKAQRASLVYGAGLQVTDPSVAPQGGLLPDREAMIAEHMKAYGHDPAQWFDMPSDQRAAFYDYTAALQDAPVKEFLAPQTGLGTATHKMAQFMTIAMPLTKLGMLAGMGSFTADLTAGALTSTMVWDGNEPNLFNMLVGIGDERVSNAVLDYLAVDPLDSQLEKSAKMALEDALTNVAVGGMMVPAKALVRWLKVSKAMPWGRNSFDEVYGYLKLRKLHEARGSFSLKPVAEAATADEVDAWSHILAGRIAKQKLNKEQFLREGARQFDEESLEKIWANARRLANKSAEGMRRMVGAPPRVGSIAQANELDSILTRLVVDNHDKLTEAASWWRVSADAIRDLGAGDPELQEELLRLFAIYGQDQNVGGNVTAVLQTLKEHWESGQLMAKGRYPNRLNGKLATLMDLTHEWSPNTPGVNNKLFNYYTNLRDELLRTDVAPQAVTLDAWMARALGYSQDSFTETQYKWASESLQRVTGRINETLGTNYRPREVQAMLWQQTKRIWSGRNSSDVVTFASELRRRTSMVPWEAVPAPETGRLQDFYSWPMPERIDFTRKAAQIMQHADGSDQLAAKLGLPPVFFKEVDAYGTWEHSFSPNRVGKLRKESIGAVTGKDAEVMTLARQYVYQQHGSLWWQPAKGGGVDTLVIKTNGDQSEKALREIYKTVKGAVPSAEGTFIDGEFHFVNLAGAEGFVEQLDTVIDAPELAKLIDKPASGFYKAEVFFYEHDWTQDPGGDALLQAIAERGRRDLLPWLRAKAREFQTLVGSYEGRAAARAGGK